MSDFYKLAQSVGVNVNDVASLNGGQTPESFWTANGTVILPGPMCWALLLAEKQAAEAVARQQAQMTQAQSRQQVAVQDSKMVKQAIATPAATPAACPPGCSPTKAGLGSTPSSSGEGRGAAWLRSLGESEEDDQQQ